MAEQRHWHGYGPWTGTAADLKQAEGTTQRSPGQGDQPEPAFLSSTMPPMQLGYYLLRRQATARDRTWSSIDPALGWLAANLSKYPRVHLPDEGYSDGVALDSHVEFSRTSLVNGADAFYEYYLQGFAKVAFGVICCPHAHLSHIPCPLPPL